MTAVQLRRENCLLAQNHQLKEAAAQAFNDAKEALNEVTDTSKTWVVKAFEMLAEADNVPCYEHRLNFQESLHRAMVAGDEPPVFQESSDDEEEEETTEEEIQADDADVLLLNRTHSLGSMLL